MRIGLHPTHKELLMIDITNHSVCDRPRNVWDFSTLQKEDIATVGCYIATNPNQTGVELSVTSFVAGTTTGENIVVPFFFQMKMWSSVKPSDITKWLKKARETVEPMCENSESFYIVLCVSRNGLGHPEPGVIYIDADACAKLLEPFGASPLKQLIEWKATATRSFV